MSRNTTFSVTMRDGNKIEQRLNRLRTGSETAIRNTVSDIRSRAPGWISKGIRKHYGIDASGMESVSVRVSENEGSGNRISNLSIKYKGRTLTLVHFGMSPKSASPGKQSKFVRVPGSGISTGSQVAMVRPPKKYAVKATVVKGQRKKVSHAYLAPARKGSPTIIAFQRVGNKIHVPHAPSVPQMIENQARDDIEKIMNENIEKRFEHNIKRILK